MGFSGKEKKNKTVHSEGVLSEYHAPLFVDSCGGETKCQVCLSREAPPL